MTKSEALEELLNCENEYGFDASDVYTIVSKIYDELEALQTPKPCDGCIWDDSNKKMFPCPIYTRGGAIKDYYEPKGAQ